MTELPSIKGRWINAAMCCACWDALNPDRKLEPERRAAIEAEIAESTKELDKNDLFANRCVVCEETVHAGIFIRATTDTLREKRKARGL
jgi:cytochrome c5